MTRTRRVARATALATMIGALPAAPLGEAKAWLCDEQAFRVEIPDGWDVQMPGGRGGLWLEAVRPGGGNFAVMIAPPRRFGLELDAAFMAAFDAWSVQPPYEKVHGQLVHLDDLTGYEVQARGRVEGVEISGVNRAFPRNARVYVLAGGVHADDPQALAERQAIFESLTIIDMSATTAPATAPAAAAPGGVHGWSWPLAGLGIAALVVAVVLALTVRRRRAR